MMMLIYAFPCLALAFVSTSNSFILRHPPILPKSHVELRAFSSSMVNKKNNGEDEDRNDNVEGEGVNLPKTGVSVDDEINAARKNRYDTQLVKVEDLPGVFQIVTTPVDSISVEPVRYLLHNDDGTDAIMIDIPPYSKKLEDEILSKVQSLRAILITTRNSIHYDSAPSAVYSMLRRPDLDEWIRAFPDINVIGYRLDVPRDCRFATSQILDGYGPFACDTWTNVTFCETGRPLTIVPWNETTAEEFMNGQISSKQLKSIENDGDGNQSNEYSEEWIRKRQEDKAILAIYTPGHTFGAMSYVFPTLGICCTGYTVPCEANRVDQEDRGIGSPPGPSLDYRGYITTSKDPKRQFESAEGLIDAYIDRFTAILPAYGDPVFLEDKVEERKDIMLQVIRKYKKLGEVYHQLGIVSSEDA